MNTANCLQFEELIETYLAQGLIGKELAGFEGHSAICELCRKSLDEARRFAGKVIQAFMPHRAPEGLEDRTIDAFRLSAHSMIKRKVIKSRLARIASIAAAALVLIAVGMFVMIQPTYEVQKCVGKLSESDSYNKTTVTNDNQRMIVWGGFNGSDYYDNANKDETDKSRQGHTAVWTGTEMETWRADSGVSNPELKQYYGDDTYNSSTSTNAPKLKEGDTTTYKVRIESDGNTKDEFVIKGNGDDWKTTYYDGVGVGADETAAIYGAKIKFGEESTQGKTSVYTGTEMKMFPAPSPTMSEPLSAERKIVKTGALAFEVESFEAAYQKVIAILTEEKGYIASSNTAKLPNGKVKGQIVIRILPDKFDTVALKLRSLGELKNQQVNSEDITKQYVDLQSRLKNSRALEERLIKLMSEKNGQIKDLLEVEKELAHTREKIELLQGEIKYYDNLTSLATITMDIYEKDISKPFEYVQTQSANLTIAVSDVESAYQRAQGIVHSLKGLIVEGNIANQDKRLNGIVKAYADAEQFAALLDQLKGLGEVKFFNASQKQTSTDGAPVGENTPVRKERGLVALTIIPPAGEYIQTKYSQVILEAPDVDNIYSKAQNMATEAQAKILNGNINRSSDRVSAILVLQVEAERFRALVDNLKGLGKVKNAATNEKQQASGIDPKSNLQTPVRKEPGIIELTINSPMAIVTEESGISATLNNTLKGSIAGLLWSLQMLIVGFLSVAPWLVVAILVYVLYRRLKRKKAA